MLLRHVINPLQKEAARQPVHCACTGDQLRSFRPIFSFSLRTTGPIQTKVSTKGGKGDQKFCRNGIDGDYYLIV